MSTPAVWTLWKKQAERSWVWGPRSQGFRERTHAVQKWRSMASSHLLSANAHEWRETRLRNLCSRKINTGPQDQGTWTWRKGTEEMSAQYLHKAFLQGIQQCWEGRGVRISRNIAKGLQIQGELPDLFCLFVLKFGEETSWSSELSKKEEPSKHPGVQLRCLKSYILNMMGNNK
jgi:hypothetical protein